MSPVEWVAAIIGIFFAFGMGVGFLIVMALPRIANHLASRAYRERWPVGPSRSYQEQPLPVSLKDWPDIGPPASGPGHQDPDDRDIAPGRSWWEGTDS
jgi:hypothetical protein